MKTMMLLASLLAVSPALAQDETEHFRLGGDAFSAGVSVRIAEEGLDDVFAAGERVNLETDITGSAHLAGRRVNINAAVGGNLYATGADVTVSAPLSGNATLSGYDVTVEAEIPGNIRAAARHIRLDAPIGGNALLAAQSVHINSTIASDAVITARDLTFGPNASIGGEVKLYSGRRGRLEVPESVAPDAQVEQAELPEDLQGPDMSSPGTWARIGGGIVASILLVAAFASLTATLAPQKLERLRDIVGARPVWTFFTGFLTLSCLLGATLVLIMTIIGILIAPGMLILVFIAGALGHLIAVYLTGRLAWSTFGQFPPDAFGERFLVALTGAVILGAISLIPLVGWLFTLVVSLMGLGAFTLAVLQPEFRTEA